MDITRRALIGTTAVGLTLAAAGCSPRGGRGSEELHVILDRLSTDILRELPEVCTSLSISEEQAGGRYIDRLADASKEGQLRLRGIGQEALAELRRFRSDSLEGQDAVTHSVVVASLENNLAAAQFEHGGGAQSPYNVTQLSGAYTNIPDFLASQHPITNRDEADAYLSRLSAYARVLDQESQRIAEDAEDGIIQPGFTIVGAVEQLRAFAGNAPGQTVLVQSLQTRLAEVGDINEADRTALVTRAETIVRDEVFPAYQRQIEALTAVQPRATSDAGVWRLPRGEEMYATALRAYTTTSLTPDEIHNMGVELIRELHSEMDTVLRSQGLTQGSVVERVQALGSRPDQIYPSTPAGRERLLADLNRQMAAITARMPEVCGTLAQAPLEIRRVPEFIEAGAPGGYYQSAALDGSRPGAYYINLRNPAVEWPRFSLPTLTYHEGTPGHHWQISIQQESGDIPFIRRALLGFGAYIEGWALYAEQLADEMGMYADDPFGRVGYLQSAVFRASRLVVDTGIHAQRWTREQAIQSMREATGSPESSVTTEIERYCVIPGQACSYMVGRQAINRMRDNARQALGGSFDIRGFHDAVLTNGSTPLSVTEQLVNQWVVSLQTS